MKFNKNKSMLVFHTHHKDWESQAQYAGIKIVQNTKVLGYILDRKIDNVQNIDYVKNKIKKVEKIIRISAAQKLKQWNMAYIFQTYAMPHINYASA